MSLRHAILVLLQSRNASGYDLAREFSNGMGLVWNATHQQIYLELGKLNERQMVRFQHVAQEGRPDKKIYSITEAGRQELIQWLRKPATPMRLRDTFMIKIAGGALTDTEALLTELDKLTVERRKQLTRFEELARWLDQQDSDESLYSYLAVRRGILGERAWLDWAKEVHQALQRQLAHRRSRRS